MLSYRRETKSPDVQNNDIKTNSLLKKTKQEGHSWAPNSYVLATSKCLIGYNAPRGLEMVLDENRVIEKKGLLALRSVYEDEMYIAQKLRRLSDEIPY